MVIRSILRGNAHRVIAPLAGLLLTLAARPAAHAVTQISVDGHPSPVTLVAGEEVVFRFDVAKAGGDVRFAIIRDSARSGRFDPAYPAANSITITDGGGQDTDPAPGKVAWRTPILATWPPAGPYLVRVEDNSDRSAVDLPGVTVLPKPETQGITGRVAIVSSANPASVVPSDAVIWAASDFNTLVASTSIRADGTYTLPLPPGTYIVFTEWFGNLRSQRQVIRLVEGQEVANVDLSLLTGQEVGGRVTEGGQPVANAAVRAMATSGQEFATRTLGDGSYLLVLPPGRYQMTAPGGTEELNVANTPLDGVDFPPPPPASTPPPGAIVTVAGNGIQDFGGEGRRATAARLPNPLSVAIDRAGNLYIADLVSQRILRVDAKTRVITTVAGSSPVGGVRGLALLVAGGFSGDGGPATTAELQAPVAVTVDVAGNLYIADGRNQRVRKVDTNGVITTVAGSGPTGLGRGSFSGDGGPATSATLNAPRSVAMDAAGNLYIVDTGNRRVRKVSPAGIISTVVGGGADPATDGVSALAVALVTPWDLTVDKAGNLIFNDRGLNRILKVSTAGIVTTVVGTGKAGFAGDGGPAAQAQIANPTGITVDTAGNLYFTDQANQRIRKVSGEGIITTVAGTGTPGFAGDGGPATEARLFAPAGLAIDTAGNLYVADRDNRRVRQLVGIAAPGLIGGQ